MLVERIIQKNLKDKIDINKLLVVTFTNAAASEMRERVLDAIYKKLDEMPEDENLQKQIILLSKSNICTIHSFCLEVIKNNFFEINFPANFRIGSEEEIELLKQEVLEDTFENLYEQEDENFIKLIECYADYKGDDSLKEIILKIYKYIQSTAFPDEWLNEKVELFKNKEINEDFSKSIWGEILLDNLREEIIDAENSLKSIKQKLDMHFELEKYSITIQNDIDKLENLYKSTQLGWDNAFEYKDFVKFEKWPIDKKVSMDLKDEAKGVRDVVKKKITPIIQKILFCKSEEAFNDLNEMYEILYSLKNIILKFKDAFKNKKREKNLIDFNDIEHFALNILVKKDEKGNYVPSDVALKYQEKFEEIAIDEYQDSNEVQEYILSTISRGNNIFMVGDVKQSIYKFRQACPELFLNKYENYSTTGNEKGLKIQLFKNFRSKENILNITNIIFKEIMSKKLGDIDYTEEEYLNLGADFDANIENELTKSELNLIELEEFEEDDEQEDVEKIDKLLEKEEIEAKFVARRIKELIEQKYKIKDKKIGIREIKYKDIVVLLRSTSAIAPIYEKEFINNGIPVFSDSSNEYLDTIEIQTIINVLKVLDNPTDDIALVSVLRSEIGGFTDNEILEIRFFDRDKKYYYSLKTAQNEIKGNLKEKVNNFLNKIKEWKFESEYLGLAELIWKIYLDTGYYNYVGLMPNGALRQANLKMLFERAKDYERTSFKGLFNFIRFIEKIKMGNSDMSSAKIIGENEDVVRIMSIHKSKGLEFPIVFLSSTSKKFNMQDLNQNILLHQKVGLGPEYINYNRKIQYPTLAKEAIKIISKTETISEEMRVLYVALTRAREKLIITGTIKNIEKDLAKKEDALKMYLNDDKISSILLKKYNSYLDWINLVLIKNKKLSNEIEKKIFKKSEIIDKNEKLDINTNIKNIDLDEVDVSRIEEEFSWKYEHEASIELPIKTTVSKIKEKSMELEGQIDLESLINKKQIGIANIVPEFMEEETVFSNAKKGTLMHLFLQKLDIKEKYNIEKLEELKQKLIYSKIISEQEANLININKILKFTDSNFYNKISKCKIIEKEKPFCMKISAEEIGKSKEDELLVQGIIDLYAIDNDDEIILIDYKTDFVQDENVLIDKYIKQLEIYKKALEEGLNRKVKEVYIYSLYLNKEIIINV